MLHDAPILTLAISPDGKTLVTGSSDRVLRWNAKTGERLGEPWKFNGEVRKVELLGRRNSAACPVRQDSLQTVELRNFPSGEARLKPLGIRRRQCASCQHSR